MAKRKMLVANEELAKQLVQIAEKRGQTLFSLLNEILEQALRVYNKGLTLKPVLDEWERAKAIEEAGFVHVIKNLWIDVVDTAFSLGNRRSLLKKWRETGHWYGKFFAAKNTENPLSNLKDFFSGLTWGASEFVIELDKEEGLIRCISVDFPKSYTELLSSFFEGILEALGYECTSKDVSEGLIRIMFKKCKVD